MQLRKTTLQEHVYEQLAELILNGEIAPGQLVTIQALSDAFGVSAMPIREALKKMVGANALTVIASRSIGIPKLTAERLADLTRVRLEIEGAAAEWAAARVTPEEIDRLERLLAEMLKAARSSDVKGFLRSNREFHFTVYRAAGSDTAYGIIEKLWLQVAPYFHHLYALDNYRKANTEHKAIVSALKSGDAEAAREGIRADIETGSKLLVAMLSQ
ncbi:MAG: GntR family transcriptional regulator [Burkholderiaceae bacterium]|nr:MAG: GntR family transcriptional regulator [Burkholderiaceae bacterium]